MKKSMIIGIAIGIIVLAVILFFVFSGGKDVDADSEDLGAESSSTGAEASAETEKPEVITNEWAIKELTKEEYNECVDENSKKDNKCLINKLKMYPDECVWACTEWGECKYGRQSRSSCLSTSFNCGEDQKPISSRNCDDGSSPPETTTPDTTTPDTTPTTPPDTTDPGATDTPCPADELTPEELLECVFNEYSKMSCIDEIGGTACSETEACTTQAFPTTDTDKCCLSWCIDDIPCTEEYKRTLADEDIATNEMWLGYSDITYISSSETDMFGSTIWYYSYCGIKEGEKYVLNVGTTTVYEGTACMVNTRTSAKDQTGFCD